MNSNDFDNLDSDLRPVADDLERLGAAERRAASGAMEDRIVHAAVAATSPTAARVHEPAIAGRITVSRTRVWMVRIAAVMAATVCVWGVYQLANKGQNNGGTRPSDVDSLLAAMETVDSVASTTNEWQNLAAQVALIQATIRGDYPDPVESDQENL